MTTKQSPFHGRQAHEQVAQFGALLRSMNAAERAMLCAVLPQLAGTPEQIHAADQAVFYLFLGCGVRMGEEIRRHEVEQAAQAGIGGRVIAGSFRKPRAPKGARINPPTQGA